MASALRSAAAAAGRAVRLSASSRSPPTRDHLHSGRALNVDGKNGVGSRRPGPDGKVDMPSQKLDDAAVNLPKRTLMQDTILTLYYDMSVWGLAGVTLFGYFGGKYLVVLYVKYQDGELFE